MMELADPMPDRPITSLEWALLASIIGVLGMLLVVWITVNANVLGNRDNGFKNRAVVCQVIVNQRTTVLPDVCLDPKVVRYYQPPPGP